MISHMWCVGVGGGGLMMPSTILAFTRCYSVLNPVKDRSSSYVLISLMSSMGKVSSLLLVVEI